ncbi:autotransporter assembly complex protein TamA [Algihabitans albus]|uniref:autotransporter assembly complex protein TamA n=1 Tax=Algihabitans albus TaxID=2164067 RepID=UPI000E5D61A3|nr:autotransporter assembly complex family protein [Algihabitans albus]
MPLLLAFVCGLTVLGFARTAPAADTDPRPELGSQRQTEQAAPAQSGIDYRFALVGELPPELRQLFDEVSQLEDLRERRPATPAALRGRVDAEIRRFEAALKSEGYYAFTLSSEIDTERSPTEVKIAVAPGEQFVLADYVIVYRPSEPLPPGDERRIPRMPADLDLELGMPARAAPLQAAEGRLLWLLPRSGYPYATIAQTRYQADHARSELTATVTVEPGPRVFFGALSVEGLDEVEEDYIRELSAWREGELWDARTLRELRNRVAATDLFETVLLDYPDTPPDAEGPVPVTLTLRERPHRTIGVGAAVTSGEEIARAKVSWEHRNFLGNGESLRLEAIGSFLRQEARATLRRPKFLRLDQALIARTSFLREESDAFDETTAAASLGIERSIGENWTVALDTAIEFSEQTDSFGTDRFTLVGLPGSVAYDTRDDLLDPTRGVHITFGAAPWISVGERESQFLVGETSAATYWSPFESNWVTFAGRARLGALFLEETSSVPASRRFYSGGGGSVRGYEFRAIGPQDEDGDPEGGRSVAEIGIEARLRLTDTIGIVPFLDGGQVYEDALPDSDFDWQWAAGLGLRYDLGIGPLRLDVAVPLNPRNDDDSFEFYLSIGQAF